MAGGGVVAHGGVRVAGRAGVGACIFLFEGRGGTLEVEELQGALGDAFKSVVGDNDGVTDFFVANINLVGARGLELAKVHERGALACGFPRLGLGGGYRERGSSLGILEGHILAGTVDNGDLLDAVSQESDLVLENRSGEKGARCAGCHDEGVFEIHDKFLSIPQN